MSEELTPIGELMARAPHLLTDTDIDRIVVELRTQRRKFVLTNDVSIGKPETRKSAEQRDAEKQVAAVGLSIDDILSGI